MDRQFPYLEVSRLAKLESYRKNIYRPPYYIHKWWARRAGTTFRSVLLGLLLEDSKQDLMTEFYRSHDFRDHVILDPFMGGGTTVGEALRLGCRVVGADVNPVAWFLVKKAVEDVDLTALEAAMVQLDMSIGPELRELYATDCKVCGAESESTYAYWVKQIPCVHCQASVELRTSRILASYAQESSRGLVSCPHCEDLSIVDRLHEAETGCGSCGRLFDPRASNSRGARYDCTSCGQSGTIIEALRQQEEPPQHRLVGLFYACPVDGRLYKGPSELDLKRLQEVELRLERERDQLLIPRSEIPTGYNTNQAIRYNYRRWTDMFSPRQLLALSVLFDGIRSLENDNAREFMALSASSALEFNSMFAAAKGLGTGAVRHVFAHHAFIPQKEPLEANIWSSVRSSGSFRTLFDERLKRGKAWSLNPVERKIEPGGEVAKVPIEGEQLRARPVADWTKLTQGQDALLLNVSSEELPIPDGSVDAVVTDPPYFDNVMYSELSDYFYVWLRLVLGDAYPQFRGLHVENDAEVIRNPAHGKDAQFYTDGLRKILQECHRVLRPNGRVVFTFHHGSSDAWRSVKDALAGAGFVVEIFYPLHSEMDVGVPIQGKAKAIRFDVLLVCRRREEAQCLVEDPGQYLTEVLEELGTEYDITPAERQVFEEAADLVAAASTWR